MSNITIENTTTIDATATLIYKGMANHVGTADACKASYYANAQGLSLKDIATATSKLLAADSSVRASSIDKSAIEQRVLGFKFILENGLKSSNKAIALSYTLAQKTSTRNEEYALVLAAYRELGDDATAPKLEALLAEAIKRANKAIADKRNNKGNEGNEGSEDSKADDKEASKVMLDSAGEVTAYIRAQAARKFEGNDRAMVLKAAQELVASLTV